MAAKKKKITFPDLSSFGIEVKNLSALSGPWQKFFARLPEIDSKNPEEWEAFHFVSYFLRRYYSAYNIPYALSYQGPPLSCFEIKMMKKVFTLLNTTNSNTVKQYIDWLFDNMAINKNMQFKGITIFLTGSFANAFLQEKRKKEKITKHSSLPTEYVKLADECDLSISTYGDVEFILNSTKSSSEPNENCLAFIQKLKAYSFDFDVLKGL